MTNLFPSLELQDKCNTNAFLEIKLSLKSNIMKEKTHMQSFYNFYFSEWAQNISIFVLLESFAVLFSKDFCDLW